MKYLSSLKYRPTFTSKPLVDTIGMDANGSSTEHGNTAANHRDLPRSKSG